MKDNITRFTTNANTHCLGHSTSISGPLIPVVLTASNNMDSTNLVELITATPTLFTITTSLMSPPTSTYTSYIPISNQPIEHSSVSTTGRILLIVLGVLIAGAIIYFLACVFLKRRRINNLYHDNESLYNRRHNLSILKDEIRSASGLKRLTLVEQYEDNKHELRCETRRRLREIKATARIPPRPPRPEVIMQQMEAQRVARALKRNTPLTNWNIPGLAHEYVTPIELTTIKAPDTDTWNNKAKRSTLLTGWNIPRTPARAYFGRSSIMSITTASSQALPDELTSPSVRLNSPYASPTLASSQALPEELLRRSLPFSSTFSPSMPFSSHRSSSFYGVENRPFKTVLSTMDTVSECEGLTANPSRSKISKIPIMKPVPDSHRTRNADSTAPAMSKLTHELKLNGTSISDSIQNGSKTSLMTAVMRASNLDDGFKGNEA